MLQFLNLFNYFNDSLNAIDKLNRLLLLYKNLLKTKEIQEIVRYMYMQQCVI